MLTKTFSTICILAGSFAGPAFAQEMLPPPQSSEYAVQLTDTLKNAPLGMHSVNSRRTLLMTNAIDPGEVLRILTLDEMNPTDLIFEILDLTGRLIKPDTDYLGNGQYAIKLPGNVHTGMYVLRVRREAASCWLQNSGYVKVDLLICVFVDPEVSGVILWITISTQQKNESIKTLLRFYMPWIRFMRYSGIMPIARVITRVIIITRLYNTLACTFSVPTASLKYSELTTLR